jgi:NADP-reducing hydrogenase subunit HndB
MGKMTQEDLGKMGGAPQDKECNFIKVGLSSCGIAAGAQAVFDIFAAEVKKRNLTVRVGRCGCSGSCFAEPLVEVCVRGLPAVIYGKVTREVAIRIIEEHVLQGRLVNDYIVDMAVRRLG